MRRPSKVDLKLKNILRVSSDQIDFASQGIDLSLEVLDKSIDIPKASANLKSILKRRPERSQLEDLNILKSKVSPDLFIFYNICVYPRN